jgi:hypothetical protein
MDADQLVAVEGIAAVGPALVVDELDLENVRSQHFHDRADLPPQKPSARNVFQKGNDR